MKNLLILLGKRIHDFRAARKWSQEEFAHISGFHRTYVGQIERGEKNISFGNLSKISGVLGLTLSELLSGLEEGSGTPVATSSHRSVDSRAIELQKFVRRLKLQGTAMDQTIVELEEVAGRGARPGKSRRGRPSKSKK